MDGFGCLFVLRFISNIDCHNALPTSFRSGVDNFNEDIHLGFGGVGLEMRNVSNLGVRSQHMCKQGMQN